MRLCGHPRTSIENMSPFPWANLQSYLMKAPIFRGFTPSSLRNQVVPPQQQGEQSRTIYTTASTNVERMKMSDLARLFETRGLKELLRRATFITVFGI